MNKKSLIMPLFCALFCGAKAVETKAPVATESLKIRVIEGKRIFSESQEGKEIEKRLKDKQAQFEKQIKSLDNEIENNLSNLRAKARAVDQEVLEKEQSKIVEMKKSRDAKVESAQEELQRAFNREMTKFQEKIQSTIIDEAKKHNLDIVIIKESGTVAYNSDKVDFTKEIIKAQDAKSKAPVKKQEVAKQTPAIAKPVAVKGA